MKNKVIFLLLLSWLPLLVHANVSLPTISQKSIDKRFIIQVAKEALKIDPKIYALKHDIETIQVQIDIAASQKNSGLIADIGVLKTSLLLAKARLSSRENEIAAKVLSFLSDYYSSLAITLISKHRVQYLQKYVTAIEKRQVMDETTQYDVLLAKQSFASAVIKHAKRGRELTNIKNSFEKLSQLTIKPTPVLSISLPTFVSEKVEFNELATQHSAFKVAQLKVDLAKYAILSINKAENADFVSKVQFSRLIDNISSGYRLTKPWQLTTGNGYTGLQSVRLIQRENEFELANVKQAIITDLKSTRSRYKLTANAWRAWGSTMKNQYPENIKLLEKLWATQKLSTDQYLDQLDIYYSGRIASLELLDDVWNDWFSWLVAKDNVIKWLDTLDI